MKTKTEKTAVIGYAYDRNRFEVQATGLDDAVWYCKSRNAKTIEEAKAQVIDFKSQAQTMRYFIDLGGSMTYRIVKVTAQCEVVG